MYGKYAYGSDEGEIELLGAEELVATWISVEHELPLAVGAQSHEGQSRTSAFVEGHALPSDLVFAELAYEGGTAAGGLEEARRLRQGHAGHRWNEVYQHLSEAHDQALTGLGNDIVRRHCLPSP